MRPMKSACGEYECPCHDEAIELRAKVEEQAKEIDFQVTRYWAAKQGEEHYRNEWNRIKQKIDLKGAGE